MTDTLPTSFTDLENLTSPLSETKPVGEWLRYEPVYDQIREARRFDDPDLSLGIWQRDLKKSDWETVEILCRDTLTNKSKDLQVAAWLAEAWTALHEFSGLNQGIQLLDSLCQQFWPVLYPPIEEDDLEYRLRILEWLDDMLTQRVIRVPITGSEIKEHGFTLADWMSANQLETVSKRTAEGQKLIQAAEKQGQPTMAQFQQALHLTESHHLQVLRNDVSQAQQAIQNFKKTIDALSNNQSPSYRTLLDRLGDIIRILQPSTSPVSSTQPELDEENFTPLSSPTEPPAPSEGIASRRIAYQNLQKIADYLDSIEPHSPTPNLLKRIVTWQDKTLAEIFAEFGDAPQDLALLARLIGKQ